MISPQYTVVMLSFILFLRMLGVFIILPVATIYIGAIEDGNVWLAGWILGGYGATQILIQIPLAWLADRFGRKKVLGSALAIFTLGSVMAATSESALILVIGRLLQGLGTVASIAAAWIADVTPPKRRGLAMAFFGGAMGLAFGFSLLLAPPLAAAYGLSGVFVLAAIGGGVALFLLLLLPSANSTHEEEGGTAVNLFSHPILLTLAAGGCFLHYALSVLFFILPQELARVVDPKDHWQLLVSGLLLAALPGIFFIKKIGKENKMPLLLAIVFLLIGMGLLSQAESRLDFLWVIILFFVGFIPLEATLPAWASNLVPSQKRATAIAIVVTAKFIGLFLGSISTGALQLAGFSEFSFTVVYLSFIIWMIMVCKLKIKN